MRDSRILRRGGWWMDSTCTLPMDTRHHIATDEPRTLHSLHTGEPYSRVNQLYRVRPGSFQSR